MPTQEHITEPPGWAVKIWAEPVKIWGIIFFFVYSVEYWVIYVIKGRSSLDSLISVSDEPLHWRAKRGPKAKMLYLQSFLRKGVSMLGEFKPKGSKGVPTPVLAWGWHRPTPTILSDESESKKHLLPKGPAFASPPILISRQVLVKRFEKVNSPTILSTNCQTILS